MEEKSTFENIGDVHLFFFLKALQKINGSEDITELQITDNYLPEVCDKAASIVGLSLEFPTDQNYIIALIKLNQNYDYSTRTPEKPFIRPERGVYSFDIDEYRTEFVRRTYRNDIVSYSKDLIEGTAEMMQNEGVFSYYDGYEVDTDYYDGETTDTKFDKDSIRKIG